MNSIIKDQLNKVTSTRISFKEDDIVINIPKQVGIINSSLVRGMVYTIEILNHDSASLNNGIIPRYIVYKVELCDKIGNKYRFNGIPICDGKEIYSESFYYWLLEDSFKVLDRG